MAEFKLVEKLLYQSEEGSIEGEFIIGDDTLWASQKIVAEIFGTTTQNISKHFNNIVHDGELNKNEVSLSSKELFKEESEFINSELINSKKGGRPQIWYNLDAIISIGYRINSKEATQFRKWSNRILKQYMIKGFVLDTELLKNGTRFGKDYFDELLEKIKEIRASERRLYQKVTDIFKECSYDYDKNSQEARDFYDKVQNKLHYAITGQTAAEIIHERANHTKKHMGLTTWNNAPDGKILKSDVAIAKNYLNKEEINELHDLVNMYLDYAENQAKRHKLMSMNEWANRLDSFLEFNEYGLLETKEKISKVDAENKANLEYEQFRVIQDKEYKSDFDKLIENIKKLDE